MKVLVKSRAHVLIPNQNHHNFTESGQIIEKDEILDGEPIKFRGSRKGRPFIYKLFKTKDGHLIHLKKVEPMERQATEISLGADAQVSPTKIDVKYANSNSNNKYIGALIGGVSGYAYCKYQNKSLDETLAYIVGGSILGFGIGYYAEGGNSRIKVQP